jgi:hypothetical protein
MKKFKFEVAIYNRMVHLLHDCSIKDFYRYVKRVTKKDMSGDRDFAALYIGVAHDSFIWIPELKLNPYNMNNLSHELIHLVNDIFEGSSIEYTTQNDEHFAYLYGHIMEEVMKYILKDKKRIKQ